MVVIECPLTLLRVARTNVFLASMSTPSHFYRLANLDISVNLSTKR